jgi:putative alpha-1,2-mannosidase
MDAFHLNGAYCEGKTFTITASNRGPRGVYIQSAKLNGRALTACWFYHKDLAKGGTLDLDLGPEPNRSWGVTPQVPE